jgi:hypothetical protein
VATSELSDLELAVFERLAAGPWIPAAESGNDGASSSVGVLQRLERLGLVRMAGSNAEGPWMLTDAGREQLTPNVDGQA